MDRCLRRFEAVSPRSKMRLSQRADSNNRFIFMERRHIAIRNTILITGRSIEIRLCPSRPEVKCPKRVKSETII